MGGSPFCLQPLQGPFSERCLVPALSFHLGYIYLCMYYPQVQLSSVTSKHRPEGLQGTAFFLWPLLLTASGTSSLALVTFPHLLCPHCAPVWVAPRLLPASEI